MGRLDQVNRNATKRAARRRLMTRRDRAQTTRGLCARPAVVIGACLCLIVVLAPAFYTSLAQSGRKREPPANGRQTTRPRTVNASTPTTPLPKNEKDGAAPAQSNVGADAGTLRGSTPQPTAPRQPRQSGLEEVEDDDVVRIKSNLVPLPAFVTDAQGRAVNDLRLTDFELLVDGQARPIAELSRAETPVTMVMLFDNSSSLRPSASRQFEKEAAAGFFKNVMRPIDRAALVSISSAPELAQRLTNDVGALVRAVERFPKPEGATAFFDSVVYAAEYLRLHKGRKALVIVSDGTDTNSELDFDETLARALALNCQIYAVRTGHSDNANLRDLAGERRLQELAAQTGGAVYVPRNRAELGQAFAQIAADLAQQYVLSYYPSEDPADGRFRAFTLRVSKRPGLQVRTRKGYYSPKE
jgi:VWFA-related protein